MTNIVDLPTDVTLGARLRGIPWTISYEEAKALSARCRHQQGGKPLPEGHRAVILPGAKGWIWTPHGFRMKPGARVGLSMAPFVRGQVHAGL
jgi:hypothetical protein